MNPASAHATNNQPGAPINRDDSAEVMKIPEPIIEPITIIVPSSKPRPRTSLFDPGLFSAMAIACIAIDQPKSKEFLLTGAQGLLAGSILSIRLEAGYRPPARVQFRRRAVAASKRHQGCSAGEPLVLKLLLTNHCLLI